MKTGQKGDGAEGEEDPGEHTGGKGGSLSAVFLWIGIALVLYVLSLGPAVKIYDHSTSRSVQHFIENFYKPLELVARSSLGRPLNWWVQLWRK